MRNKQIWLLLAVVLLLCTACSNAAPEAAATPVPTAEPQQTQETVQQPAEGDITVELPVAQKENGIITAEQWAQVHPEIYSSYMANGENKDVIDHVEEYPMIAKLYEGMAFNKFYNSARGHVYTLEDVSATGRPHPLANCLTCKTPDFTKLVNDLGVEVYKYEFGEVYSDDGGFEPVSCYNCHANQADTGEIVVTHSYLADAMASEAGNVAPATLSCAQCHVEYYFDPETKATTLPYSSLETLAPDAILSYYNEMDFTDYTNPRTGVKQIKVQHPEFETFMGEGSVHAATGFNCATCHMGQETAEGGKTYTSHTWTSPLNNDDLIANNCAACHQDLKADVKAIQEASEARVNEIGYQLEMLTDQLAEAVESGKYAEEKLEQIRSLNRDSQFYWDFVFVENSEGAHNSKLTNACLDQAQALCEEALGLLK